MNKLGIRKSKTHNSCSISRKPGRKSFRCACFITKRKDNTRKTQKKIRRAIKSLCEYAENEASRADVTIQKTESAESVIYVATYKAIPDQLQVVDLTESDERLQSNSLVNLRAMNAAKHLHMCYSTSMIHTNKKKLRNNFFCESNDRKIDRLEDDLNSTHSLNDFQNRVMDIAENLEQFEDTQSNLSQVGSSTTVETLCELNTTKQ